MTNDVNNDDGGCDIVDDGDDDVNDDADHAGVVAHDVDGIHDGDYATDYDTDVLL